MQQLAVDDAYGSDLDNFITARWIQPGRFCIKDGVGEFAKLAIFQ